MCVQRRSRVATSDLESQPVVTSHNCWLRVAMVISVLHGLVTSRNGTRNRGLGWCCLWSRVETGRFRLAI
ncbi:hypothetical protein HanOQP8_Chr09g0310851 [Helianthus annuus]|nr:hypothetical protein HanOQP8_Chr09g0310851 [Helianthus annuus]